MHRSPCLKAAVVALLLAANSAFAADLAAPSISITAPAPGASVAGTISVSASATDDTGVVGVQFLVNGAALGPEDTAAPFSVTAYTTSVPDGAYTLTAVARDAAGNRTTSAPVTVHVANATTPYSGTPAAMPGIVEAENFDRGGEGIAYHDSARGNAGGQYRTGEDVDIVASSDVQGGGYVVNNFTTGEWLNYTINVTAAGVYDIELRASSAFPASAFRVEIDGRDITGTIAVPNTGSWSAFQWIGRKGIPLSAGRHVMKVVASQQYFNLNSIRIVRTADTQAPSTPANLSATVRSARQIDLTWSAATDATGVSGYYVYRNGAQVANVTGIGYADPALSPATTYSYAVAAYDAAGNVSARSSALNATTPTLQSPYSGTPATVPGSFEAEDFDRGGMGIAYRDNVVGNVGGLYRASEDVDIVVSSDSLGGSYVVNNFETGEWLAYTINVQATGRYDIALRASSAFANSAFHVEIDGVDITGRVTVPNTGDWNSFQWVGRNGIALSAGTHVLRIVSDQQYFNLNSVRVTASAPLADPGTVLFSCSFPASATDCGFFEQAAVPGRASLVGIGRDGGTGVRLHTEPGDSNVNGSGSAERNDLALSQAATACHQGSEQWWSHSVLFPDDYVVPPSGATWHWGVVADFHHTGSTGQANFHVLSLPDGLRFRGFGGATVDAGQFEAPIGPVVKNVWYDFVYHVKWSSGSDGYFDAWVNGVQRLAHRGPTLYAGMGCYLKLANYHSATGQASSLIHDRVIRGSTALAVSLGPLQGVLP